MKIYRMNECDWWIGESLEACKDDYAREYGDPDAADDARELTDEELDRLMFRDDEGEDSAGFPQRRSFREQLAIEIDDGGTFPRLFASTEQ